MTAPRPPGPRLLRDPANRVVGGVAAGLARHLGAPVIALRIGFFVLALVDGLGAILYAVFWAVLPASPEGGRRNIRQLIPFGALGVGVGLAHLLLGGAPSPSTLLGWLAALVALGTGIIWHQAGPRRRQRWSDAVPNVPWLGAVLDDDRRGAMTRFLAGGLLVVFGVIGIIAYLAQPLANEGFAAIINGLVFAAVGLAGVGLALAPVLWRMFTQLTAEREGRIREQERAEIAAMVHDQVLNTLVVIYRNAADTKTVQRLARGQERTLRKWLYQPTGSPSERIGAALEQGAAEVEDTYGVEVEVVIVGDRDVDERTGALVAAAREALVNAARHARVTTVSVYAEVEEEQTSVFVRDRGVGFDPSTVDDERHGVRNSILGRMKRHGGTAEIRSEPGGGTEVRLTMPQADPRRGLMGDWLGGDQSRGETRKPEPERVDIRKPERSEDRKPDRAEGRKMGRAERRRAQRAERAARKAEGRTPESRTPEGRMPDGRAEGRTPERVDARRAERG
jgi:signal transduction histidine kinase/phage shock protein PspC (stress-responsive transcriptional regulator)